MTDRLSSRIEVAGLTDVGRKRRLNEDAWGISPEAGLLVVADGMGGHDKGEVASRMAVEAVAEILAAQPPESDAASREAQRRQTAALRGAVAEANRRISDENRAQGYPEGAGMGTTIAGLWLLDPGEYLAAFHVGDSRVYRFRDGMLEPVTRDHTLYQDWLDGGRQGEPPRRNIILRALGPWPEVDVDISLHRLEAGDVYLICSDGLCGLVEDPAIEEVLRRHISANPAGGELDVACVALVALANAAGGSDNITVLLARGL